MKCECGKEMSECGIGKVLLAFCLPAVVLVIVVLVFGVIMAFGQKAPESVIIAPETAQEIITAYEAQENARLAYIAAQAKAEAVLNKAKAQAKCWPCSLNRNAQGQLVLIPDPPPKETPK